MRYLIVDEISMVSAATLWHIHRRLVDTPEHWPFGGINLIVLGDFYQVSVALHVDGQRCVGQQGEQHACVDLNAPRLSACLRHSTAPHAMPPYTAAAAGEGYLCLRWGGARHLR